VNPILGCPGLAYPWVSRTCLGLASRNCQPETQTATVGNFRRLAVYGTAGTSVDASFGREISDCCGNFHIQRRFENDKLLGVRRIAELENSLYGARHRNADSRRTLR
jgi:hypothetical protein